MEKKELTVEELKAIASGLTMVTIHGDRLYATAETLAAANLSAEQAKLLGVTIVGPPGTGKSTTLR